MIEEQLQPLADEALVVVASFLLAWRYVKPWAEQMRAKVESTDRAVNGGRMDRVETSLKRGTDRMDKLDGRIDRIETRIDSNHDQVHDRLTGLEEGQRQILNHLQRKEPS